MTEKVILLSIKKKHADEILTGEKLKEYRTVKFSEPIRAIIYVSKVGKIVGEFMLGPVCGHATKLPRRKADYYPLQVSKVIKYRHDGIPWALVQERIPNVRRVPEMFTYLRPPKEYVDSELLEMLEPYRKSGIKVNWT